MDPPCQYPGGFAGRYRAADSARRASGTEERERESARVIRLKLEQVKDYTTTGEDWGLGRVESVRQQAIITHGVRGRTWNSEHGTLDPGHWTLHNTIHLFAQRS